MRRVDIIGVIIAKYRVMMVATIWANSDLILAVATLVMTLRVVVMWVVMLAEEQR
jgi:hypothetical protein